MNILHECAIDDDIIIIGYFADCIYINIIGGKYIFRVKTNNPPPQKKKKKKKWAGVFYVFFFFFFLEGGGV